MKSELKRVMGMGKRDNEQPSENMKFLLCSKICHTATKGVFKRKEHQNDDDNDEVEFKKSVCSSNHNSSRNTSFLVHETTLFAIFFLLFIFSFVGKMWWYCRRTGKERAV